LIGVSSCETIELDLLDSPNALQPDQASIDFFLNAMQEDFARFVQNVAEQTSEVTRIKHMFGPTYANAYSPATFNGYWRIYSQLLADARVMVPLAEQQELFIHSGISKVLEAYVMVTLVDVFGDVPYSEAIDPNILNPKVDNDEDIYAAMFTLIDEAIADFNKVSLATPESDLFYGGDASKWIKLANSLKLKMYLTTGLVNAGSTSGINSLIAGGNLIGNGSEDFAFPWGTEDQNPDSRHPKYGINYDNATSSGDYMSTYYMWSLIIEKDFQDPRTRYYFYRQVDSNTSDVNEQGCITQPKPAHYAISDPYCNINHPVDSFGYWGRDHGNDNGIPPDDFLKTTFGVYPVGGQFDADQAAPVARGMGGGGAGITPIILSSYVNFMRAAAALELGTTDNARAQLEAGIRASMAKVTGFLPEVDRGGFGATQAEIDNYVNFVLTNPSSGYDTASASGKLAIVIKEYYLSVWGNGIEAYNNYRRTGFPDNLQPTVTPNPGAFMRSFLYPSNHVNLNENANQKPNVEVRVFWDTNPDALQ